MTTKVLHVTTEKKKTEEFESAGPGPANVVSFHEFKLKKERFKELHSYQKYLSFLHAVDLLNEVKFISTELSSNQDYYVVNKAKLLMKELSNRVMQTSPRMSVVMKKLIHNLESNLSLVAP